MKRFGELALALSIMLLLAIPVMSQSLADVARSSREQKKPAAAKVFTNDDLASVPASRMAEQSQAEATASNAEAGAEATSAPAAPAAESQNASQDDKAAENKEWKGKISDQQEQVKSLEKEIDLMQRENKLRQASYYGDAGNQLRDQKKWADEQRTYQTDLEAKQKALQDAKQKLDDTREDARKSGVPSGQLQ